MNLFELATKEKYRFQYKGTISTEDLWDLSRNDLNSLYMSLNSELKDQSEESLLKTVSTQYTKTKNKIEIVKYIFDYKTTEYEDRLNKANEKKRKEKIIEIIDRKENQTLENMSIEELKNLI